jgi:UDPglucose 6-dehydrogenase
MKITVCGSGYVGLVTGACLAEMGNHVLCLDVDHKKVAALQQGQMPIHEPGLEELVVRNAAAGRMQFTTDIDLAVGHGTLQIIAVGTPPDENGSADLRHVVQVARGIGERMSDYKLIIDKSTVPVGTADMVEQEVRQALQQRGVEVGFAVVSNPEFLKEGAAIDDFMKPDRVVIGADDERAIHLMRALYSPFIRNRDRVLVMDRRSAELTKYAANAMLATRISFMNELANLAERLGADIELVRQGLGSDPRIGTQFLYAGCGYGGSCFPKDVKALGRSAQEVDMPMHILAAVEAVNEQQKNRLVEKVVARFGAALTGRRFAVWGLAFKPGTDDMREAPSLTVIRGLVQRGATIVAYDPVAMSEARRQLADVPAVTFADSAEGTLVGSDALIVVTEWKEFRSPDFQSMHDQLRERVIFDGRNIYEPQMVHDAGLEYHGIGRALPRRGQTELAG